MRETVHSNNIQASWLMQICFRINNKVTQAAVASVYAVTINKQV